MYGVLQYGIYPYSIVTSTVSEGVDSDIVYNNYPLQSENVTIYRTNFDSGHTIQSDYFNTPLGDGGSEINYYFREKIVTMYGIIKADNAEELNNEIDRFKKILLQNNRNLDIKVNGTIRRAKASLMNAGDLFTREHYNITFLNFTIQFRVLEKFKEINTQTSTFTGKTGNFVEVEYNNGTAKVEPKCIFVFNSASGTDTISIVMGGKTIQISQTVANGDIVTIDSYEKTVSLNDVDIDYLGTFPILDIGENTYNVNVNGTVNYNFTLQYFNTFL